MSVLKQNFIKFENQIINTAAVSTAILVNNEQHGIILRNKAGKTIHWLECDAEAALKVFNSLASSLPTQAALKIEGVCHVSFEHITTVKLGKLRDGQACLVIKGSDKHAWVFITENDCPDLSELLNTISQILVGDHKNFSIDLTQF